MPVYRPACEDAYLSLVFSEGVFITESTAARRWEHGFSPNARGLAHGPMPWRPSGCPSAGAHGGRTAARVCPTRPPNRGGTCAGGTAGPCRPARLDCDRSRPLRMGGYQHRLPSAHWARPKTARAVLPPSTERRNRAQWSARGTGVSPRPRPLLTFRITQKVTRRTRGGPNDKSEEARSGAGVTARRS